MEAKRLENTLYHSLLRVLVCVFALVLIFDSGLLVRSSRDMSNATQQYLATAVGVYAGVAPTEVNQLTARITELETELVAKERVIAVNLQNGESSNGIDRSTLILSAILFILLTLIILNYVMDYLRSSKEQFSYEKMGTKST